MNRISDDLPPLGRPWPLWRQIVFAVLLAAVIAAVATALWTAMAQAPKVVTIPLPRPNPAVVVKPDANGNMIRVVPLEPNPKTCFDEPNRNRFCI